MSIVIVITFSLILSVAVFIFAMSVKMMIGRIAAAKEIASLKIEKLSGIGQVDSLTVIPLVDFYAVDNSYKTEEGVSYLIKAGSSTILFDLGYNKRDEHPSPLLKNLEKAGVSLSDIDAIVLSHVHRDHIGGNRGEKNRQFSLSAGKTVISGITVYSPAEISPSENNPGLSVKVVKEPAKITDGVATIGIYPRSLFLIGYTSEQSLAVNVKGKGIVLIIGCGHQGVDNILKRTQEIFDEPVYGIIGGVHLPVRGGRVMAGPFNLQNIVGVDRRPLRGIRESDVYNSIQAIKKNNPSLVSISPHDSSDWTIEKFKEAFTGKYIELQAGKAIKVK